MLQYVGMNTPIAVYVYLELMAPGSAATTPEEHNTLRSVIALLINTKQQGFSFVNVNMDTSKRFLFTDASFANARDRKSHLSFIVILTCHIGRKNILHDGSNRCMCVTRSVSAFKLHALVFQMYFLHTL